MKRNVILTCDQKPTWVRLIYSTEQQLTDENRKSGRLKSKTDMLRSIGKHSEKSVESVQEKKRQAMVGKIAEKESFKPGVKEWRGDGWWEWWVDGTNGGNAARGNGWGRIGEISAGLMRGARSWFQRRGEAYRKERFVIRREDDVDGWASVTKDEEWVLRGGWTVMKLCRYEGWVVVRTL